MYIEVYNHFTIRYGMVYNNTEGSKASEYFFNW